MNKLRLFSTIYRRFSGCGYNAIPKNMEEFDNRYNKEMVKPLPEGMSIQDYYVKFYEDKYFDINDIEEVEFDIPK